MAERLHCDLRSAIWGKFGIVIELKVKNRLVSLVLNRGPLGHLKPPRSHIVSGGSREQRVPGKDVYGDDVTVAIHEELQLNLTLNPRLTGQWRVAGGNVGFQSWVGSPLAARQE
jgi:hypothetical protein